MEKSDKYFTILFLVVGFTVLSVTLNNLLAQCWEKVAHHECFVSSSCDFQVTVSPSVDWRLNSGHLEIFTPRCTSYNISVGSAACTENCDASIFHSINYTSNCCSDEIIDSLFYCDITEQYQTTIRDVSCDCHITYITEHIPLPSTVEYGGEIPSLDEGVFYDTLMNQQGCDSIIYYDLVQTNLQEENFNEYQEIKQVEKHPFTLLTPNYDNTQFFIPNVISPNGDGANDFLIIYTKDTKIIHDLVIFDSWGGLVFEAKFFQTNTDLAWSPSAGNYVYMIVIDGQVESGSINVIE